jgi:hypothetical protein
VCQHLRVTTFIARCELHDVVEDENATIARGVEDPDLLELALFLDNRCSGELDGLGESRVKFLQKRVCHRVFSCVNSGMPAMVAGVGSCRTLADVPRYAARPL